MVSTRERKPAELPILFTGEMIRAILAGRKTVTRRVVKPQPSPDTNLVEWNTANGAWVPWQWSDNVGSYAGGRRTGKPLSCPYGTAGDLLYVRETWYCDDYRAADKGALHAAKTDPELRNDFLALMEYRASHDCAHWEAGCPCRTDDGRSEWRPSILMPKWASRIWLRNTGVRVERVQEITDEDCFSEGLPGRGCKNAQLPEGAVCPACGGLRAPSGVDGGSWVHFPLGEFSSLWDATYAKHPWKSNPFVWTIDFEVLSTEGRPT